MPRRHGAKLARARSKQSARRRRNRTAAIAADKRAAAAVTNPRPAQHLDDRVTTAGDR